METGDTRQMLSSTSALSEDEIKTEASKNLPQWQVIRIEGKKLAIQRVHTCHHYLDALTLLYRIGNMAEAENHHPDLLLHYKRLTVRYWTHSAKGVTRLDLDQAKKVDALITDTTDKD